MASLARALTFSAVLLLGCEVEETEPDPGPRGGHAPVGVSSSGTGFSELCSGNTACIFGEFCDTPDGACSGEGICKTSPVVCTGACTGVCGCDGAYYCNACVALKAGVDVDLGSACEPPPPLYTAVPKFGEPNRVLLLKQDMARDICTQIVLAYEGAGGGWKADVTAPWAIESVFATDHALDCHLGPSTTLPVPVGQLVVPTQTSGSILVVEPAIPCSISVSMELTFEPTRFMGTEESFELPGATLVLCE